MYVPPLAPVSLSRSCAETPELLLGAMPSRSLDPGWCDASPGNPRPRRDAPGTPGRPGAMPDVQKLHPLTNLPLEPLGVFRGRLRWPILGGAGDDGGTGDTGTGGQQGNQTG